jgi:phage tail sheath protein FI
VAVATSYPGIYIQELASNANAIAPTPTSIAAFIGYSHPFKTKAFGVAQQIFSFSDYETYFGGLFSSGMIDASLARAVYQFFLNGGSTAWVVGLQPGLFDTMGGSARFGLGAGEMQFSVEIATDPGKGMRFTAAEPTDTVPMAVQIANVNSTKNTFDVIATYGSSVEAYRNLTLTAASLGTINGASSLVSVAPIAPATDYGATLPKASVNAFPTGAPSGAPAAYTDCYRGSDILAAFESNGSLDNVEIFNLLIVPGNTDNEVISVALAFAERKRAFAIIDPPPQAPATGASTDSPQPIQYWMTGLASGGYILPLSQNGALYFPYLAATDPVTSTKITIPPSGFVAGVYATTDANRGVWKAPAGLATVLLNTAGPVAPGVMNDPQQGVLNLDSINCLRSFSSIGTVVWGSRTLVAANPAYQQNIYVPVRRMTLFIEQSLLASLRWVVFEPNDEPLWIAIRTSVESFLLSLFNQGALQGSTPSLAFKVTCDSTTTTPDDQALGIVNIIVAFAPLKPAEFVVIKIAQLAGQTAGS